MDKALQNKVNKRIDECLEFARRRFNMDLPRPTIQYNLNGRCAGRAYYFQWKIELNPAILQENEEDYIRNTVPHEFAHLLTDQMYTFKDIKPHGPEWKKVMREMGVIGVTDTYARHNYDTSSLNVKRKRQYIYECNCPNTMTIGPTRHQRHQQTGQYYCKKCRATIRFVREHPDNVKVKTAAQNKKTKKTNGPKKGTKMDAARLIVRTKKDTCTRKQMLKLLSNELGITENTANTYYYKILNEIK